MGKIAFDKIFKKNVKIENNIIYSDNSNIESAQDLAKKETITKESKYQDLCTNIILPHLQRLVNLTRGCKRKEFLMHEWIFQIEKTWSEYLAWNDDSSGFTVRFNSWINELRDRFYPGISKAEVETILYEAFDVSAYCYFEYERRREIRQQIQEFYTQVDCRMKNSLLKPKYDTFKFLDGILPFIEDTLLILEGYKVSADDSITIPYEVKQTENLKSLEKIIAVILIELTHRFIDCMQKHPLKHIQIQKELDNYLAGAKKFGFNNLLTDKLAEQIEKIKKEQEEKPEIYTEEPIHKGTIILKLISKPFWITVLILCSILLIGIPYGIFSTTTITKYEPINKTRLVIINQTVFSNISYNEYFNDVYRIDKTNATVKGFLQTSFRGEGSAGAIIYQIVDDEGNVIELIDAYPTFKQYLPQTGKTDTVFAVNGIFKRVYKTLYLKVITITPTDRTPAGSIPVDDVEAYTENVPKYEKIPTYPKFRKLMFDLLGRGESQQ